MAMETPAFAQRGKSKHISLGVAARNKVHQRERQLADGATAGQRYFAELSTLKIDDADSRVGVDELREIQRFTDRRHRAQRSVSFAKQLLPALRIVWIFRIQIDRDESAAGRIDIGDRNVALTDDMSGHRA